MKPPKIELDGEMHKVSAIDWIDDSIHHIVLVSDNNDYICTVFNNDWFVDGTKHFVIDNIEDKLIFEEREQDDEETKMY